MAARLDIFEFHGDDAGGGDLTDAAGGNGDADARGDQPGNGDPLGRFLDHIGAEAVLLANGNGSLPGGLSDGLRKEDKGFFSEQGNRDGFAPRERMRGRNHGNIRLREDTDRAQAGNNASIAEETHIDTAVLEALHQDGGVQLVEAELDLRKLLAIPAEELGDGGQDGGGDKADVESAAAALAHLAGGTDIVFQFCEGLAEALLQLSARGGELDVAGIALEKGKTNPCLKLAYLLGERRLRHVELFRGSPEVQLLSHGKEITEVPQLNIIETYHVWIGHI